MWNSCRDKTISRLVYGMDFRTNHFCGFKTVVGIRLNLVDGTICRDGSTTARVEIMIDVRYTERYKQMCAQVEYKEIITGYCRSFGCIIFF